MLDVDPNRVFKGAVLIAAPHMDDEVLACGGTIALLSPKDRIHLVYATDGMRAPEPILPWCDSVSANLGAIRMQESRDAVGHLGVPQENLDFLGLPEGRLGRHRGRLVSGLEELIGRINPSAIVMPFRYDRHADHLELNHAIMNVCQEARYHGDLFEYFVYWRSLLLPKRDIRKYIRPRNLLQVRISGVSSRKREALDAFRTQTTRFYDWQTRPNLTPELLDQVSLRPEVFLRFDSAEAGPAVFDRCVGWIRLAHRLEPAMKKRKDWAVALWLRASGGTSQSGG